MEGKSPKRTDNVISFIENWNNKLQNHSFTTIRPVNHYKYRKGKLFWIEVFDVKTKEYNMIGKAKLVASSAFYLNNISDTMAYIDCNMCAADLKKLMTRLYAKSKIDVETCRFNMLVLQYEKKVY